MLPVRLREALIGGGVLSLTQIYLGIYGSTTTNWTQVCLRRGDRWCIDMCVCVLSGGN